jgi:hypothetical protein
MYKDGTLRPVEVILRREEEDKENNSGDEPSWVTLYPYVEISQLYTNKKVLKRKNKSAISKQCAGGGGNSNRDPKFKVIKFFFPVLGFKLRTSHLCGRRSTT